MEFGAYEASSSSRPSSCAILINAAEVPCFVAVGLFSEICRCGLVPLLYDAVSSWYFQDWILILGSIATLVITNDHFPSIDIRLSDCWSITD